MSGKKNNKIKPDDWRKLRDQMNTAKVSGQPSPLEEKLKERLPSTLASAMEMNLCRDLEYYETFDIEEEKELYPIIKKQAEKLLKNIEHTFNFKIWTHRKNYDRPLKELIEFASRRSQQYPAGKRWKERNRINILAYSIAKTLDANGQEPKNSDEGALAFAISAVFESLGLEAKDLRRRIIPRALETLKNARSPSKTPR